MNDYEELLNSFDETMALSISKIADDISKQRNDFILKCFENCGFTYEDIISNKQDFEMIENPDNFMNEIEVISNEKSYLVLYKGLPLFKIKETCISTVNSDAIFEYHWEAIYN